MLAAWVGHEGDTVSTFEDNAQYELMDRLESILAGRRAATIQSILAV